jgi:hypothetical protein
MIKWATCSYALALSGAGQREKNRHALLAHNCLIAINSVSDKCTAESILSLYSPDVDLEENFLYGGGASILGLCSRPRAPDEEFFSPHKLHFSWTRFRSIIVAHTRTDSHLSRLSFVLGSCARAQNKQEKYTLAAVRPQVRRASERRRLSFQHMIESPPLHLTINLLRECWMYVYIEGLQGARLSRGVKSLAERKNFN